MPALIHFVYASVATQPFGKEDLTELLRQSRPANSRLGLTGMLLYSQGSFFQVLEGQPDSIDALYRKLLPDPRHRQVTAIIREPISKRYFGEWSMGFSTVSPYELADIEGTNDFFHGGSCFTRIGPGRAKKLLTAFAGGRWRARLAEPELARV